MNWYNAAAAATLGMIFGLIIFGSGCENKRKPPRKPPSPIIEISDPNHEIFELVAAGDTAVAREKYIGSIVIISGYVHEYISSLYDTYLIVIGNNNFVRVDFRGDQSLHAFKKISIKGVIHRIDHLGEIDFYMMNCKVVK